MQLTWTRKKEWGSEGMTHRALHTIGETEWSYQVLSPRPGYWTLMAWSRPVGAESFGMSKLYREDTTMRGAKRQAEHHADEQIAAARTEGKSRMAAAVALVEAARARVQFRVDTCGCKTPLHTMRCGVGGVVTVVAR